MKVEIPNIVIDASNTALGRVASFAAKQAILGKKVAIVNCKEAIVTGNRRSIISEFNEARRRGGSSLNGPHYPKSPERIMKRLLRGMLPYKQARGLEAWKRVMCYNTVPKELESEKKVQISQKTILKSIKLWDLSNQI